MNMSKIPVTLRQILFCNYCRSLAASSHVRLLSNMQIRKYSTDDSDPTKDRDENASEPSEHRPELPKIDAVEIGEKLAKPLGKEELLKKLDIQQDEEPTDKKFDAELSSEEIVNPEMAEAAKTAAKAATNDNQQAATLESKIISKLADMEVESFKNSQLFTDKPSTSNSRSKDSILDTLLSLEVDTKTDSASGEVASPFQQRQRSSDAFLRTAGRPIRSVVKDELDSGEEASRFQQRQRSSDAFLRTAGRPIRSVVKDELDSGEEASRFQQRQRSSDAFLRTAGRPIRSVVDAPDLFKDELDFAAHDFQTETDSRQRHGQRGRGFDSREFGDRNPRIQRIEGRFQPFSGPGLKVLEDMDPATLKPSKGLELWQRLKKEEMNPRLPPRNGFEEMIQWTEDGKMWHYPINNEQGWEEEMNTEFYEHVFLEHRLDEFPDLKPVRDFMELVLIGLSKNSYYTVEEKNAHIDWFLELFTERADDIARLSAEEVGEFSQSQISQS